MQLSASSAGSTAGLVQTPNLRVFLTTPLHRCPTERLIKPARFVGLKPETPAINWFLRKFTWVPSTSASPGHQVQTPVQGEEESVSAFEDDQLGRKDSTYHT